jgi:protein transport protein SEC31
MTAIPLDTDPLILLWDLRNSNAPEKVSLPSDDSKVRD